MIDTRIIKEAIEKVLSDKNAIDVVTIPLAGKSDLADYIIVASGTSTTHIKALSSYVAQTFKKNDVEVLSVEGDGKWILVDTAYAIVHIFHPEVREYYNLEKMWEFDEIPDTSTTPCSA